MPALAVAIAKLKGGVGKSSTTVMLADGLANFPRDAFEPLLPSSAQ